MNLIYTWFKRVAVSSKSNVDAAAYFFTVWFFCNLAFYALEHVIWGDNFVHFGDVILALAMAYSYTFVCILRGKNENSDRG